METDLIHESKEVEKPLEIDIHKILTQIGIAVDKWPEEFKRSPKS